METGVGLPRQEFLHAALVQCASALSQGQASLHLPPKPTNPLFLEGGHFHRVPEFFYQISGATRFNLPSKPGFLNLEAGSMLLIPPGLSHGEVVIAKDPEDFCNLVILVDKADLYMHLAHGIPGEGPRILHAQHLRHEAARQIGVWLGDVVRLGTMEGARASLDRVARSLLMAAMNLCHGIVSLPLPQGASDPPIILQTHQLVMNNLGNSALSVAWLARTIGVNPDYLSTAYGQHRGQRLMAWITNQRMERAADLLGETTLLIKEVAWACGFRNQSYFNRCFLNWSGTSPQTWRINHGPRP